MKVCISLKGNKLTYFASQLRLTSDTRFILLMDCDFWKKVSQGAHVAPKVSRRHTENYAPEFSDSFQF